MSRSKIFMPFVVVAGIITVIALAALALQSSAVHATPQGDIGRYQISSWAAYSGGMVHHSGYYTIDTVTGKVVDRGHEIHGIEQGSGSP